MNAGLEGMADGRDGSRKVIAQTGRLLGAAGDPLVTGSAFGLTEYGNASVIASGAKTLLYSARGKGAARFFHVSLSASAVAHLFDVEIDGVVVASSSLNSASGSRALVGMQVASAGAIVGVSMDYMPFASSFKVYLTPGSAISINFLKWSYLMEAHQ